MEASNIKFTTSGINKLHKPQPFSRSTYPYIINFEKLFLYLSMIFMSLSPAQQMLVKQEAQRIFFAWMEQKRSEMVRTTHHMKRMRYKEIVEKILASVNAENGLFTFLSDSESPAFTNPWNYELPVVSDPVSSSNAIPSPPFVVTGVIPFSPKQITLFVQTSSNANLVEEPVWNPFDSSNPFDLPSVPAMSMTFPPPYSCENDTMAGSVMSKQETEVFFANLCNPDIDDTLREIQASEVWNKPNLDSSIGPCDLFQSIYPCDSEQ
jgi:hypothetical protein